LLQANSILATKRELMEILPEGEQFVGTRGGAMDHAAVLASRSGCALLVRFSPFEFSPIQIPENWCFLVAHSLTSAEKSGALRAEYNARRSAGTRALERLGFTSYRSAVEQHSAGELKAIAERGFADRRLSFDEFQSFMHVTSEARRVKVAVDALRSGDMIEFGRLLSASHASLRDRLRVSSPALDELVETAIDSGALGARLTGAGFGGCAVILCRERDRDLISDLLASRFYSSRGNFVSKNLLFAAEPSAGALYDTAPAEYASRSETEFAPQ
jgi:galactokinase